MRVILGLIFLSSGLISKEIVFLSTQLVPVHEAEWVRKVFLSFLISLKNNMIHG